MYLTDSVIVTVNICILGNSKAGLQEGLQEGKSSAVQNLKKPEGMVK